MALWRSKRAGQLPKYRQIADDLRARIEAGEYPVDSQLPTKPELMDRYGAALGTIDSAIGVLRELGLVETRQGAGMYVREPPPQRSEYDVVMNRVDELAEEIRMLQERMSAVEQALPGRSSSVPEPQPVVAAIVTSRKGVLIARRNDGRPPWTFIAGEIEPGESPADAAVREVKEETGLRVTAGERHRPSRSPEDRAHHGLHGRDPDARDRCLRRRRGRASRDPLGQSRGG